MVSVLATFAAAVRALPSGTVVSLPREAWLALLGATGSAPDASVGPESGAAVDGTVEEVAHRFGRAPSTVRAWLAAGHLQGYKLWGREWRIPAASIAAFQVAQKVGGRSTPPAARSSSLDAWRAHARGATARPS